MGQRWLSSKESVRDTKVGGGLMDAVESTQWKQGEEEAKVYLNWQWSWIPKLAIQEYVWKKRE